MTLGIQGFGFCQKSMLHHHVDTAVDALDKGLAVPKQGVFLDVEVALDGVATAEG